MTPAEASAAIYFGFLSLLFGLRSCAYIIVRLELAATVCLSAAGVFAVISSGFAAQAFTP